MFVATLLNICIIWKLAISVVSVFCYETGQKQLTICLFLESQLSFVHLRLLGEQQLKVVCIVFPGSPLDLSF